MEDQSGATGQAHILLKTGRDACHRGQGEMTASQSGLANSRALSDNADGAEPTRHLPSVLTDFPNAA